MTALSPSPALTPSQRAALAKVACGITRPGGVALLCGPQGVGTTTVLAHLAVAGRLRSLSVEHRDLEDWDASIAAGRTEVPDVVIADEAHRGSAEDIVRLLGHCRRRPTPASLVLAGEGRLHTLVARDNRLERAIHLRACLRPCTRAESRDLIAAVLGPAVGQEEDAAGVVRAIHEITAGIPAALLRLADLVAVLAASRPDRAIAASDVETIHRRLSPQAA